MQSAENMPRGRPRTTGTGHRGARVAVSPETAARIDELALAGETRPEVVARVVEEAHIRAATDARKD